MMGISTVVYVVWHPLNAVAFNPTAIPLFLNPWFLVITCALGATCGYSYALSRSIWVPVIIHWVTVTVWVLLLGGARVTVGDYTLFGPAVQIYTATHPLEAELRRRQEYGKLVEIGSDDHQGLGVPINQSEIRAGVPTA